MAEVYTISGSGLGAPTSITPPLRLQNALKALGDLRGDPALTGVVVDGIIGPKTVKAVNYAIAHQYVVMKDFPRPELTLAHVRQFSNGLALAVEAAVKAGGGKFSPITAALVHRPKPASGKGGGAMIPVDIPPPAPESDRKWVWWVVGGASVLVALSLVASSVKRKRSSREAEA